jgi:hypothetical protein
MIAAGLISFAASPPAVAASPSVSALELPLALRGCWVLEEPASEQYPEGLRGTLQITADKLIREANGVARREGSLELVERIGPTAVEGRITAIEEGYPVTLATTLELDTESGELLLREGDAGSYSFRPCDRASEPPRR